MKDFRLYDIMDFVMDEDFIRWVREQRPDDEAFWANWLQSYPEKHLLVAEARRILESIRIEEKAFSETELATEALKLLQTIRDQPVEDLERPRVRTLRNRWLMAAVTTGIVITAVTLIPPEEAVVTEPPKEQYTYTNLTSSKSLIEQVNTSDKPIIVTLADGSQIELAVDSRISYQRSFDSTGSRDVYLSGEAFFRVARNPNMPFRVFAHEIVTKVLGTSFKVRSFEKDSVIQVIVKTGKVSVYSQFSSDDKKEEATEKQSGIILTPNQKLMYSKVGQKFHKLLLDRPALIVPVTIDRTMVYEDTPLEKVFEQIGKAYGINIVYDNELLETCTVTADLRNEAFYDKLDLICRAIGATYEVMDGQVVISSPGCR